MRFPIILVFCLLAILSFTSADGNARPAKPMFKGVELYSWRDSPNRQWSFSLLAGTNRNKTLKEIKSPKSVIVGVKELKRRMSDLAVGEHISWSNNNTKHLSYPPKKVRDDISKTAQSLRIHLYIADQK